MVNKYTYYLSVLLLSLPLVAQATDRAALTSEQLRLTLSSRLAHCSATTSLDNNARQRLIDFYLLRDGQPAWHSAAQLQQLREQIAQLADDGLQPLEYPLAELTPHEPEAPLSCADLLTSHSYLQALHHLRHGRLPQQRLEPVWRADEEPSGHTNNLLSTALYHLATPAQAFANARPATPQYQRLRQAYAEQRRQPLASWPQLPAGRLLKPGQADQRLPILRVRLEAEGYLPTPMADLGERYDPATVEALQAFQADHGLQPDGILGPASLDALNLDAQRRREQLRANLERLRWLADDMRHSEVLINVAAAELLVMRQGQALWRSRTQVGRPDRKTPLLASQINRLTLNPTWTVPPTILREDKLPAIREDLDYLQRQQMSVLDRDGNPLDPQSLDWDNPGPILLRQAAGPQNPLGRVALRFANPFSVYLHDTPSQRLFDKAPRAFSSGCVRVQGVDTLLAWLLSAEELAQVQQRIASGNTQEYRLQRPAPLLIAYWTVEAGRDGKLRYAPDPYNWDERLIKALPTMAALESAAATAQPL